jgi:hypothetical protein
MNPPLHLQIDRAGLPLVSNMISQDLTDDEDPAIGEKIAEIHRVRYAKHSDVADLVGNLDSYEGSGVHKPSTGPSGDASAYQAQEGARLFGGPRICRPARSTRRAHSAHGGKPSDVSTMALGGGRHGRGLDAGGLPARATGGAARSDAGAAARTGDHKRATSRVSQGRAEALVKNQ